MYGDFGGFNAVQNNTSLKLCNTSSPKAEGFNAVQNNTSLKPIGGASPV